MKKIRHILDDIIFEYCEYRKYGSPNECAQRRESMSLPPDEIREAHANTMLILQRENNELKNKLAEVSKERNRKKKSKSSSTSYDNPPIFGTPEDRDLWYK